jgi:hypothetical protein
MWCGVDLEGNERLCFFLTPPFYDEKKTCFSVSREARRQLGQWMGNDIASQHSAFEKLGTIGSVRFKPEFNERDLSVLDSNKHARVGTSCGGRGLRRISFVSVAVALMALIK